MPKCTFCLLVGVTQKLAETAFVGSTMTDIGSGRSDRKQRSLLTISSIPMCVIVLLTIDASLATCHCTSTLAQERVFDARIEKQKESKLSLALTGK